MSYAIIGVGGFLGMGKHEVAVPMSQLKENQGKIVLHGATMGEGAMANSVIEDKAPHTGVHRVARRFLVQIPARRRLAVRHP